MRAGQTDPVDVELKHDRKLFGPITGRAGQSWEDTQKTQGDD